MKAFNLSDIELTKYLFFTGKGGVGKTSIACATAVGLADKGEKILLISTDPASNLQDVFNQTLNLLGDNYLKALFKIWKNNFQALVRLKLRRLMSFQTLSPMLTKQRSTTTLFSIQHQPDTHCECCSFHRHGVRSLVKVHMAHPV